MPGIGPDGGDRFGVGCLLGQLYQRVQARCLLGQLYQRVQARCLLGQLYQRVQPRSLPLPAFLFS
jgi:hypothetical protein